MKRDDVMRTMGQHFAEICTGAYVQINILMGGSVVFDMNSCYTAAEQSRAQHSFYHRTCRKRIRDQGVLHLRHVATKKVVQDSKTVKLGKDKLYSHKLKI